MSNKYLITPSLYNAYTYYTQTNFEIYGDKAEEIEAKALQDWLNTLNKVKTPTNEILQRGIDFENAVRAITDNYPVEHENAAEVAEVVKGGMWQVKLSKNVGNYVLYGIADVIKRDTVYDIKRVTSYDCPKYEQSIQHLIYLECSGLENFEYLVSDGKNLYREYYHKDADNLDRLIGRINNMVGFIKGNDDFHQAFEKNWHSKY